MALVGSWDEGRSGSSPSWAWHPCWGQPGWGQRAERPGPGKGGRSGGFGRNTEVASRRSSANPTAPILPVWIHVATGPEVGKGQLRRGVGGGYVGRAKPRDCGDPEVGSGGPRGQRTRSWVPAGKPGCWWGTSQFSPRGQPRGSVRGQWALWASRATQPAGKHRARPGRLGSRLGWTRCFCLRRVRGRVPVGPPLCLTGTGISDNFHVSQNICLLLIFF